jgi:deoxyribodipyrimidine photo-lyase
MSTALVWFRQDLRCRDNPALALACASHEQIIPLYIKETEPSLPMGAAQHWWLYHSLNSLKKALREVRLDLYLREAAPLPLLKKLIETHKIAAVYWNRCYEPAHRTRDQQIKSALKALGIKVVSCNGSLLNEPWEILNKSGQYYKVFTPYWRACLRQMPHLSRSHEITSWPSAHSIASDNLQDWNLLPTKPNWALEFSDFWQPGEEGASKQLELFLNQNLTNYKEARNIPALSKGTSHLSPHLHFGELSPHQIWNAVQSKMRDPQCNQASAETFLAELGWREFSYQLLYHYEALPERNFKTQFDSFPWSNNAEYLACWKKGLTGYPIVDAGMRELWRTGYMHNRVRMIVASFLTKDLMIDWRQGAAWFWDTLLDADLASNSASWQWVAGSGADAAPYYRIFNPVLQGEKFDPQGDYIKRWVPELSSMPKQWIHHPWDAPKELFARTGYPQPLVDHSLARQLALDNYKRLGPGDGSLASIELSTALTNKEKDNKDYT